MISMLSSSSSSSSCTDTPIIEPNTVPCNGDLFIAIDRSEVVDGTFSSSISVRTPLCTGLTDDEDLEMVAEDRVSLIVDQLVARILKA